MSGAYCANFINNDNIKRKDCSLLLHKEQSLKKYIIFRLPLKTQVCLHIVFALFGIYNGIDVGNGHNVVVSQRR